MPSTPLFSRPRACVLTTMLAAWAAACGLRPVQAEPLPEVPRLWKFHLDPDDVGRKENWFALDVDESKWRDLKIGQTWESQDVDYDGVAWYRVRMKLPETPKNKRLVLQFGAVDEEAWVYVNGVLAGEHAKGVDGWKSPFAIDVTDQAKPDKLNLIAVRVYDRRMAGGIWKPVKLAFVAHRDSPWAKTPAGRHAIQREQALKEARAARKGAQTTVQACINLGYWQQLTYHEAWLAVHQATIDRWELDARIADLTESRKPVPKQMATRLAAYEQNDAIRAQVAQTLTHLLPQRHYLRTDRPAKAREYEGKIADARTKLSKLADRPIFGAIEKWAAAQERIQSVQRPYGWHVAKLTLLRDLLHRRQRIRFYLTEAATPEEQKQRLAAMAATDRPPAEVLQPFPETSHARGRDPLEQRLKRIDYDTGRFRELYGDCYFGQKLQTLLVLEGKASQLDAQTRELVERLVALEEDRQALEKDVLAFLAHFDKDGKFATLGMPYRDRKLRVEPDGRTSQLVLKGTLEFGGFSEANSDALCLDATSLWYIWGIPLKAQGTLGNTWRGEWPSIRERGYGFSQDVTILSHRNTAVVHRSFFEEHKDDRDIVMRTASGSYGNPEFLNFWHPAVRRMIAANLGAIARFCNERPGFLFYDKLTWEPGLGEPGPGMHIGYNPHAKAAFHKYLKGKFGNIAQLNKRWRSGHKSFESIPRPDPSKLGQPGLVTPLIHEFEAFQNQSWVDYLTMCVQAIRKHDTVHPVATETYTGANVLRNTYNIASKVPVQYLDHHSNASHRHLCDIHWLHDLCQHTGKYPVDHEYIWTHPRTQTLHGEKDVRVNAAVSVWRKMAWGYKMLNPFGTFNGWNYNHGRSDERYTVLLPTLGHNIEKSLLREAATALTLGKKRAGEYWSILSESRVVQPEIGLICEGGDVHWDRLLRSLDFDFRYLPKQLIVDRPQVLAAYRVLILPLQWGDGRRRAYPPNFPDGLDVALLNWVESGGTLICSGVPGVYDHYGFKNGRLMTRIFGADIGFERAGEEGYPAWRIQLSAQEKQTAVELRQSGQPALIRAGFGKGAVLVSAEPLIGAKRIQRKMQEIVLGHLNRLIAVPTASSEWHRFELVTRQDRRGQRYVFVINTDIHEPAEDLVTVKGEFRQVMDLGISSICAVPLVPREPVVATRPYYKRARGTGGGIHTQFQSAPGTTSFFMRLQPGEGTVLKLIP